ncbi:MAG TPA: 16S rRNA (guanine(966)-N(2))-methyltransferase RsmD [Chloroflexota bacterium]|nr:16S rRNA (guanine(966)-N(2))-methyltransferase RsmD [Chloroflexota bacterium]
MRVIAGRAKGHRLLAPKGMETRPTTDKVREAIFSMLGTTLGGETVLDLFAGTGALGIEALSRGASSCVFIERREPACRAIRANLAHTKLASDARVLCAPVERVLPTLNEPFDLVFLDPPYAYAGLDGILKMLSGARAVGDDTTVVFEHSPRFVVGERYGRLILSRQKIYGDTAVAMYDVEGEEQG